MADINTVTLTGRISQDIELKYFESGSCKAILSIAVNKWNAKEKKEEANFFNVEIWNKQAEFVGEYGKKGQQATILGNLDISKWTDEAGNNKQRVFIHAQNIVLGSAGKKGGSTQDEINEEDIPF